MKKKSVEFLFKIILLTGLLANIGSCDFLQDINEIKGPCTIILKDGSTVVTNGDIEISERTGAITYKDDEGKLNSLFKDDYESYTCD